MDGYNRGRALLPEEKQHVVRLRDYFERTKSGASADITSSQRVADALCIGLATVNRIMAEYNKNPESITSTPLPKGRPAHAIDASLQELVRSYVREMNSQGKYITLESIKEHIQDNVTENFHIATLARTLDRWGFEFGKGVRAQHLNEKDYIISARRRYLRKIRLNRATYGNQSMVRPEVYLDESYINKNHSNDFIWYNGEDDPFMQKPTGKGERLIILNAITKDGWVPNAKVIFKSTRKTGDYHGQMTASIFKKWFTEQLLPNIPKKSFIIMDNAPYHNILTETSAPTKNSSKARIYSWLESNGITCSPDCLKSELIEALNKFAIAPTYEVDEIAKERGHEVLRTPPYHPELQPIEICWGVVKNEVGRHCDFTMQNLVSQLDLAFSKVTSLTCMKIISKIRSVEDKYWHEDSKSDEIDQLRT